MTFYTSTCLIAAVLLTSQASFAADNGDTGQATALQSVADLNASIDKQGASKAVHELYSNRENWNALLGKIGTGDDEWLSLAGRLLGGSDAGMTYGILGSLGSALDHSPKVLLQMMSLNKGRGKTIRNSICNGPDFAEDRHYNTYALALAGIEKRKEILSQITESALKVKTQECLKLLDKGKINAAKWFRIDPATGQPLPKRNLITPRQ